MSQITSGNPVGINQQTLGGGASIDEPARAIDPNLRRNTTAVYAKYLNFYLPKGKQLLALALGIPLQIQPPNSQIVNFKVEAIASRVVLVPNLEIALDDPRSIKDIVTTALKEAKMLSSPVAFKFYDENSNEINLEDMDVNRFHAGDRVTLIVLPIVWSEEKKQMIAAVRQNGQALQFANARLRNDRDVVLAAVSQNGFAHWFASRELQADKEVVLAAVSQNGFAHRYASPELQADKEVVLAAVAQNGMYLFWVSPELQADKEVVLAAVRQDGRALSSASAALKVDIDVVLAAVRQSPTVLQNHRSVFFNLSSSLVLAQSARNQNIGIRILGVLEAIGRAILLPFVAQYELCRAGATSTKVDMNPYIDTFKQSVTLER